MCKTTVIKRNSVTKFIDAFKEIYRSKGFKSFLGDDCVMEFSFGLLKDYLEFYIVFYTNNSVGIYVLNGERPLYIEPVKDIENYNSELANELMNHVEKLYAEVKSSLGKYNKWDKNLQNSLFKGE